MRFNFSVAQEMVETNVYWIARCKEVPTVVGQGDTPQEAIAELEANEQSWLTLAEDLGLEIPTNTVSHPRKYSGKFMTRVSPTVHAQAAAIAADEGISLNQYVSDAISYYNGLNRSGGDARQFLIRSLAESETVDDHISQNRIVTADFGPVQKRE